MNDRPDATELLEIARRTLLDEILPRLPHDLRYSVLMVASAMAIAGREHAARGDAEAELARLHELMDERIDAFSGPALHAALAASNRRLASAIRAGRFDGAGRAALLDHLQQTSAAKLAVANPKALAG